ncbi:DUF4176 domain-containing protein [Staphylococcus microti]|nr:DUF4176 domain-containing protein [Staphylococcus microti]
MNKTNDNLPIGSVVLTETGEIPLMIVNRAYLYDDNDEMS